jgi:hypothetical protein
MRRNQHIVGADGSAGLFQMMTQFGIVPVSGFIIGSADPYSKLDIVWRE